MAKGVEVKFLSRTITFYPLTLRQIQELSEEMKVLRDIDVNDAFSAERFGTLVKIFTASAQRGDKSLTESDISDLVDMGNVAEVTAAVLGQSGFRNISAEDAAAPMSPRTGGESTPP
jgi:hypothetical protein